LNIQYEIKNIMDSSIIKNIQDILVLFFPTELCNIIRKYSDDVQYDRVNCIFEHKYTPFLPAYYIYENDIWYILKITTMKALVRTINTKNEKITSYVHGYNRVIGTLSTLDYLSNLIYVIIHSGTAIEFRHLCNNDVILITFHSYTNLTPFGSHLENNIIEIYYPRYIRQQSYECTGCFKNYTVKNIEVVIVDKNCVGVPVTLRYNEHIVTTICHEYKLYMIFNNVTDLCSSGGLITELFVNCNTQNIICSNKYKAPVYINNYETHAILGKKSMCIQIINRLNPQNTKTVKICNSACEIVQSRVSQNTNGNYNIVVYEKDKQMFRILEIVMK